MRGLCLLTMAAMLPAALAAFGSRAGAADGPAGDGDGRPALFTLGEQPVGFALGDWSFVALSDKRGRGNARLLMPPRDGSVPEGFIAELFPDGGFPLDVNVFLLRAGDRVVLFDSGNGPKRDGRLPERLAAAGVAPAEVTDIVLTHLHGDHIGGLVDAAGNAAFPKARLHLPLAEKRHWMLDPDEPAPEAPASLSPAAFAIKYPAEDPEYGRVEAKPIKVGGGVEKGAANERRFLLGLSGPEGQDLNFKRRGSCCPFKTPNGIVNDGGLLDIYDIGFEGAEDTVTLYINMYDFEPLRVPAGFKSRFADTAAAVTATIDSYGERAFFFDAERDGAEAVAGLPGLRVVAAQGHTPGHTGYLIENGGAKLFIWGDLMHCAPAQLRYPAINMSFDVDPEAAAAMRAALLERAAREGWTVAGMHLPYPGVGRIEAADDGAGYELAPARDAF